MRRGVRAVRAGLRPQPGAVRGGLPGRRLRRPAPGERRQLGAPGRGRRGVEARVLVGGPGQQLAFRARHQVARPLEHHRQPRRLAAPGDHLAAPRRHREARLAQAPERPAPGAGRDHHPLGPPRAPAAGGADGAAVLRQHLVGAQRLSQATPRRSRSCRNARMKRGGSICATSGSHSSSPSGGASSGKRARHPAASRGSAARPRAPRPARQLPEAGGPRPGRPRRSKPVAGSGSSPPSSRHSAGHRAWPASASSSQAPPRPAPPTRNRMPAAAGVAAPGSAASSTRTASPRLRQGARRQRAGDAATDDQAGGHGGAQSARAAWRSSTGSTGASWWPFFAPVFAWLIASTTSRPSVTRPNTA